jgi:PqqD family protein of HPr-rel-A system
MTECADVLYRKLVDGGLIYDGRSGQIHHLNETAAAIWEACRDGVPATELVRQLCERYDVSTREASAQVHETLNRFAQASLLS